MLRNFPEDYELIGFFDAEPVVLDPEVPWIYNTLEFSTNRNGIEIRARISPSYREVSVSLVRALGGRLGLQLGGRFSCFIMRSGALEALIRQGFVELWFGLPGSGNLIEFELAIQAISIPSNWEPPTSREQLFYFVGAKG